MPLSNWFWILMLFYVAFGVWRDYTPERPWYRWGAAHLIQTLLLCILGWAVFQGPIR